MTRPERANDRGLSTLLEPAVSEQEALAKASLLVERVYASRWWHALEHARRVTMNAASERDICELSASRH